MVALWFQEERVHVGVAGDACGLGLHSLCTSYLKALRGGITVERHVLCLEGCRMVSILSEDTAECGGKNALAHIAASPCKHHGV